MPTKRYHPALVRGGGLLLPGITSWRGSIYGFLLLAACHEAVTFSGEGVNPCQLVRRTGQQTALETICNLTDLCQGSILGSRALRHGVFH